MKVLVTGGRGLLGGELQKLRPGWHYPSHEEIDIVKEQVDVGDYDAVIHAAAITNTTAVE